MTATAKGGTVRFLEEIGAKPRKGLVIFLVVLGGLATGCARPEATGATSTTFRGPSTTETAAPETIPPPTSTTSSSPSADSVEALAVANAYFAAYESDDLDLLFPLFAPDVLLDWFTNDSLTEFEKTTAFFTGQGTVHSPPDCDVTHEVPGESVHVFCHFGTHTAASQAVDAPLVDTRFTMVVTPEGISRLTFSYDEQLDFHPVEDPFELWILSNHPDDHIKFGDWTTVEEAHQQGRKIAGYALDWADYLKTNNCTYLDDC